MPEAASPTNRFEQRRQRNRAALLEAAIELFQQQGIRATKLEEICERADVSARTFFNHFETREHLYQAIAHQRALQMAALMELRADDPRTFRERLTALFASVGAYLSERPAYRELVSEMLSLRPGSGAESARAGVLGRAALGFVVAGVERGEVTRRHRPEVLADLLLGSVTTTLDHWCADEAYDLEEALGQAARALLDLFD
jgi:AcrR family transcriptional regulator